MARLMCVTQIETREIRQSDQEIDFWFSERPAVRDYGVEARSKCECLPGGLDISFPTGYLSR
jgi:hypothetical protein